MTGLCISPFLITKTNSRARAAGAPLKRIGAGNRQAGEMHE